MATTSLCPETVERKEGIRDADLSVVTHAYHHPENASNLDNKFRLGVNLPHISLNAKQSLLSSPGVYNPRSSIINFKGLLCSLICYWIQATTRSQNSCNDVK